MTDTSKLLFPPIFDVDPKLKAAIERCQEAAKAAIAETEVLKNAINPWQTFLQASKHTASFLSQLDWVSLYNSPPKQEAYKQAFSDLTDLQKAAFKRIAGDQQDLINILVKDGKAMADTQPELSNPQATAAKYIDQSLDTYGDVKENLGNQAQTAMSIQAAVLDWYQQSLTSIVGKAA